MNINMTKIHSNNILLLSKIALLLTLPVMDLHSSETKPGDDQWACQAKEKLWDIGV